MQETRNALWHHLTELQLDPSASYKKSLAQYSLCGQHGRGDGETGKDVVGGSEEEKKRVTRTRVGLGLAFTS